MIKSSKINKYVTGMVTSLIIIGGTPHVVRAVPIDDFLSRTIRADKLNTISEINEDRLYEVEIKALKENKEEPSMAGGHIKKVNYEVKAGKKYLILSLDNIDWMKNISVTVDGKEITPTPTDVIKKDVNDGMGEEKGKIKFEVGNLDSKIMLHMNVVPMGNARVAFRIVLQKDTLKLVSNNVQDQTVEKPEEKPTVDGQIKPEDNLNVNPKDTEKPVVEKNGIYEVAIKALKEKEEDPSMAGGYIKKVNYEVKDGKKYLILSLDSIDWMKNISVTVDGTEITLTPIDVVKKDVSDGLGEEKGKIKFEVDSLDSKIMLHMNSVPMGNARVAFRVVPQKDTLKFISDNVQDPTVVKPDTDVNPVDQTKPENPIVDGQTKPQDNLNVTPKDTGKPKNSNFENGIYKINNEIKVENEFAKGMCRAALDEKSQIEIRDENIFVILKLLQTGLAKDTKVFIDGKEVKYDVIKQEESDDPAKSTKTIRFQIPNINCDIKGKAKAIPMKGKEVEFGITLNESSMKLVNKENDDIKDTEKPDTDVKPVDQTEPGKPTVDGTAGNMEKPSADGKEKPEDNLNVTPKDTEKPAIEKNGVYEVAIKTLKENKEEPSMAGGYITKVNYEVRDGKKYLIFSLDSIDWMQNISVTVDGTEITPTIIDVVKKGKDDGKGEEKGKIKFEVGSLDSKIMLHMNVQPMGNARVAFRVIPEKNTLRFISENVQDQTVEKPDADAKPVEQTKQEEPIADGEEKPEEEPKKSNFENGMYKINNEIKVEDEFVKGMCRAALDEKSQIEIKDENIFVILKLLQTGLAEDIRVFVDGKEVKYDVIKQEESDDSKTIRFQIPNINCDIKGKAKAIPMKGKEVEFGITLNESSMKLVNKENGDIKDIEKPSIEKEGIYKVSIKALKENKEEPSMAGGYITKVNYEVKDGKKYLILSLDSIDWMNNISVTVDGKEITLTPIDVVKKDISDGKGEEKGKIKFEVGSLDSKIMLHMNSVPMGNARVTFRVVPQKDTLKFINDNVQEPTVEKPDADVKPADQTKPEKPTADGETDNIEKPNENDKKDTLNNKEQKTKVEENSNKDNDLELNTHKRKVVKKIESKNSKNENKDNKTKLPKTGMPIGVTSLGVLGSILVGIGSSLRKNNKRK